MERRSALKNMGLAFGYAVATPTLLGILQSCKDKAPYAEWVPSLLSKDQGYALAQTLDIILPKTDTPSATELNLHVFIDSFLNEVMPEDQLNFVKLKMDRFYDKVLSDSGKESLADVEATDIEPVLKTYLAKRTPEVEEAHTDAINSYMESTMDGGQADIDDDIARFSFANDIRDMAIWAFKNTEFIGEEVLAYDPIPGQYIPCDDVTALTDGKAWSL
ncbi:gluconate 2-dehydrogenase subunit 3 family protein [Flagellimonas iocasae]|uniref:Gluconate 2-dehydrogenase subunit 3 family protein n=1 Tax=Flagellimonas iocasae TaxID=2055905 RepID=A0ABW4Y1Y7_9FLAO